MNVQLEDSLDRVTRSKVLRETLGRLATFPDRKDEFLLDPPAAVRSLDVDLDDDEIRALECVVASLDALPDDVAHELRRDTSGADNLIK